MYKYYLFLIPALLLVYSCKKEPVAFADLNAQQLFDLLQIGCSPTDKPNYFTGTLDGEPFCYYESDTDSVGKFIARGLMSTSPIISTGATDQYRVGGIFLDPSAAVEPGMFQMLLLYRDTAYVGDWNWTSFMKKNFIPNTQLPFSLSSAPEVVDSLKASNKILYSHIHGLSVDFHMYSGYSALNGATLMTSASAAQPATSYAKCTKFKEHADAVELELEIDIVISGGFTTHKPKRLKGVFHFFTKK